MSEAVILRFAQEELVYLLRALRIQAIPGASATALGTLDADHIALAMANADRSLRARNAVLLEGPEQRKLDPVVAGLLRACVGARYTLLAEWLDGNTSGQRFLYSFADYAIVEHSVPDPDIHQFTAFADTHAAVDRVHALLETTGARPGNGAPGRLSNGAWMAARAVAAASSARAQQVLATELPAQTAAGLAESLTQTFQARHLALWPGVLDDQHPHDPQATLTVISGAGGTYAVVLTAPGGALSVEPADPALATRIADELMALALAVLRAPQPASDQ